MELAEWISKARAVTYLGIPEVVFDDLVNAAKRLRDSERAAAKLDLRRPRSPIEMMIDRACGLA